MSIKIKREISLVTLICIVLEMKFKPLIVENSYGESSNTVYQ